MTEAGSAGRLSGGGGGRGQGRGQACPQCSLFSLSLRHPGPGLPPPPPQSQRLAFSLDSHHRRSVRLAQPQQAPPTGHRGGRGGGGLVGRWGSCGLDACLDAALGTMAWCIYPQITKLAFCVSSGRITTSDISPILPTKVTELLQLIRIYPAEGKNPLKCVPFHNGG